MIGKILGALIFTSFSMNVMASSTVAATEPVEDFETTRRRMNQTLMVRTSGEIPKLSEDYSKARNIYDEVRFAFACLSSSATVYDCVFGILRDLKEEKEKYTADTYANFVPFIGAKFASIDGFSRIPICGAKIFEMKSDGVASTTVRFSTDLEGGTQILTIPRLSRSALGFTSFDADTAITAIDEKLDAAMNLLKGWRLNALRDLPGINQFKADAQKRCLDQSEELRKILVFMVNTRAEMAVPELPSQ